MNQQRLKQLLTYHPDAGTFTWNESRGPRKAGSKAGSPNRPQINVEDTAYSATRLAWLFMTGEWPTSRICFLNSNKNDLRWANLYSNAALDHPLDAETLRKLLKYDASTGVFTWLLPNTPARPGDAAGSQNGLGYICIGVAQTLHRAHRLAWLYMTGEWPKHEVDHIDGDPTNNSWANLRAATHAQNTRNTKLRSTNTSGFKGVYALKGKFCARVMINGKSTYLGIFDTVEAANAIACATREEHHGEFARH